MTLLPPPADWGRDEVEAYIGVAKVILGRIGGVANVPEVVPYSGVGERPLPFRPKVDLLTFARLLKGRGVPSYIDRYVSLMEREEYLRFLSEAAGVVEGVVVVGKVSSALPHPGYDVLEGIRLAKGVFGDVGAIVIFEREGEVERACDRVKAGATFLVSQITFHPDRVRAFLEAFRRVCPHLPRLYVSIAPVFSEGDLALLKWMRVDVPSPPPELPSLVREVRNIPGVYGINYEHLRYSNLKRLAHLDLPP